MLHKFYKRVSILIIGAIIFPLTLLAQVTTGKVTDADGNPIADVSVQVKGKKELNATNRNGEYAIKASGADVLVFSSVGFGTVEVRASEAVAVKLKIKTATLSDVVVVGFGEKKRKNITSSIGSVKGEALRKSPVATFDQALAGRIAGLEVTSSTGDPGGKVNIRIRGNTTVSDASSNDPLFVVDDLVLPQGVGINSINPSDIESIDVLKDAAATSIYGIRAANGVVVVKTKRGTKDKNKVTLDVYTGVNQPWKRLKVLNIQEHAEFNNDYLGRYNQENPTAVQQILNPEWGTPARIANLPKDGTNWQDAIFQAGFFRDANLGFSGGSGRTTYYFSLGNRDEKGIILNSTFKRTNIRANIDNQVKDWLRVGVNVSYSNNRRTVVAGTNDAASSGLMQAVLLASPDIPKYAADGTPGRAPVVQPLWYGNVINPISRIEGENIKYGNNDIFGSAYANIKFPYGFSFNTTIGAGKFDGTYSSFASNLYFTTSNVQPLGNIFKGTSTGMSWNLDNFINWNRWIKGHAIEVTVGHVAQGISNAGLSVSQTGFTNQTSNFQILGLGDPLGTFATPQYPQEFAYESYFGRLSYNYKERYYLGAAYRIDKASPAFATANKTAYFPAISAKWRLTNEKFFEPVKFFSDLSLRGSWGISGNIGNKPYTGFSLIKINSNYPFGGGTNPSSPGVSLGQYPNVAATWEKIYQTDFGIDATMLDGKISLTFDVYNRKTRNMLLPLRLRSIFGSTASAPLANIPGDGVENKGMEISLGFKPKMKKDFNYEVNGNISFNKNKVVDIGNNPFISLSNTDNIRIAVGQPISSFYGWVSDGIYQNQGEVNKGPVDQLSGGGSKPGDIRFKDLNNDGKIDVDDRTYIGQPTPTYTYGFNVSASYKAFDFSLLIQGVGGNKIFNKLYQQATLGDDGFKDGINRLSDVKDRWVNDGQTHSLPRIIYESNQTSQNTRMSDFFLQNGAFTRIKNVQIGYTIPNKLLKKIDIERIRFYISGSNLFTFTKYKGFDPEVGQNTTGFSVFENKDLGIGVDAGVFPQPRMLLFGMNLTF
jgi:TonB-dependent starch-binding outer membrane protein SusC